VLGIIFLALLLTCFGLYFYGVYEIRHMTIIEGPLINSNPPNWGITQLQDELPPTPESGKIHTLASWLGLKTQSHRIPDEGLRQALAGEVKTLKKAKRFGLVFEDHLP
jgi:hypothetical protein